MGMGWSFYDGKRIGKMLFLALTAVAIVVFLIISNNLVKDLAQQEKERMNIWAKATERLACADIDADFDFLLTIIQQNNSIPVLIADSTGSIREFRNFRLPDKDDEGHYIFDDLTPRNRKFLSERLRKAIGTSSLPQMARGLIFAETFKFLSVRAAVGYDYNSHNHLFGGCLYQASRAE
jgi:hypothetical protein